MHTCLTGWLHCQSRFNHRHIVTGHCRKAVSSYRSKVYLWSTLSLHRLQRLTHFMVSSKHLNQPQIHTVRFLPTTYLQSTVLLVARRQTEETGEVELGSCIETHCISNLAERKQVWTILQVIVYYRLACKVTEYTHEAFIQLEAEVQPRCLIE